MKEHEKIEEYMKAIGELDAGDRAAMMRSAGTRLQDAGRALPVFYSALPYGVPEWAEGRWFAAGCLSSLRTPSEGPVLPLPQILQNIRKNDEWSSYMRARTVQLLDTKWSDEDGYLLTKMTRFVKMLHQKGRYVDCGALLQDLIDWNRDSGIVQRRWASAIYRDARKEN